MIALGSRGLTLTRKQRSKEPGYNIDTFPKAVQEQFLKDYRARYPLSAPGISQSSDEVYAAPSNYSDSLDHFRNFLTAVRGGKKVVEEAAEVWMAAEHEGAERTAEEISQLLYHLQVLMLASDIAPDDVYRHL